MQCYYLLVRCNIVLYLCHMAAILIKTNSKNKALIEKIARITGSSVTAINDKEYEDFLLAKIMRLKKTNKTVTKSRVIKELNK